MKLNHFIDKLISFFFWKKEIELVSIALNLQMDFCVLSATWKFLLI